MSVFDAVKMAFLIYGLAIVISVLVAGLIKMMSVAISRRHQPGAETAAPPPAPLADAFQAAPEVIAAITAAVHATLGTKVQIQRVRRSRVQTHWAAEGRMEIMLSHRLSKK